MCFLCVISQWSRRIASMLPWLVIPFIFMWALSQLLPPSYRLEVTSSRLACLTVLLMSLVWYELLMPWLSQWRAHRSALLRERKLIEALEAAKWRKEATRRCRNCLTAYRIQMPGSGKYVCTYCGHISKRPVLEVAGALANPKLVTQGPLLGGNGAGMQHLKGSWHGNGPLAAWSRAEERNRCTWYGEGSDEADKCSLGQSLQAPFLFISRTLAYVWQRLLGVRQSNTDGLSDSNRVSENTDDFSRIRSEKARRKADKKKQARLQKEILEAEDRKQREEVALLVEERRRQRDELEVTKQKEREAGAERRKEARRNWDTEKLMEKAGKQIIRGVTDGPTDLGQEHQVAMQKSSGEVVRMAAPMGIVKEQVGDTTATTTTSSTTTTTTAAAASTTTTSTIATTNTISAKVSRGTLQGQASRYRTTLSSFPRLGLLKGTGSRQQKVPGSAPNTGIVFQGDGSYRGKKDAALVGGKSSISLGSSNSSSKAAGTTHAPDSAWKRAPWISAWVKGSKGVTGDDSNMQCETITDGGKRLDRNFSSGLKSSNNHAFVSKSSLSPVRGTAIQPPIAPPSVHIDPLQQLFSTPSLFSPMNLRANINNQFERKTQSEMKAVFSPEHTFFEAQSYAQSSDCFAPPCISPPIQMPMPVLDTVSISSQPTLDGTENSFVQSNVAVPQSSVLLETLYDGVPTLALEPTSNSPLNPCDINAKDHLIISSFLGPLKVSELEPHMGKEDFLPWDSADDAALQSPPLRTVQSLFDSETAIPDMGLVSSQKMGSPKVNKDAMVNGLQDPGRNSFSLGFDTAAHIWDAANGSQKVPAEFVDCITQEIMEDPVITADGHSYERSAIEKWLKHHDTSPKTGEVLPPPPGSSGVDKTLRPNHILRGQIIEYKERLTRMSELRSMSWSISAKDAGSFFKMTSSPGVLSF